MDNICFDIHKINIKNAIAICNPKKSDINECKKINTCDHNDKCYYLSQCSSPDFNSGNCVRNCDTLRDNICYSRNFCGHETTNLLIKSQPLNNLSNI